MSRLRRAALAISILFLLMTHTVWAAKTVLTVADWWNPEAAGMKDWWDFIKADFEKKHPDVELDFMWFSSTTDARQKLIVSYAG